MLVSQYRCLAVIPARGGSKRIPRKNVREFLGRPMIAYTIEAARESGIFARVIVSTDDPEVAEVSSRAGAEIPFMRTAALADDYVTSSRVTSDALEKVDPVGDQYVYAAQLLPTCPLRIASDVENSFRQMVDTNASSQISVTRFGWLNPWWAVRRDSQFRLTPLFAEATQQRSQDLPSLYEPVGAIWWAKTANLRNPGFTSRKTSRRLPARSAP